MSPHTKTNGLHPKSRDGHPVGPQQPAPNADSQKVAASVATSASVDAPMFQKELTAQEDAYLRLAADFDNFRKRTRRDSERQDAAGKEAVIADLLPAIDNLERALAFDQSGASAPFRQGVTMTLEQLGQLLRRHGIEAVEDVGQQFDPDRHEAISVRNDPDKPDHSVLEVTRRGYCCGERVFRPAMVIVNDLSYFPVGSHAS